MSGGLYEEIVEVNNLYNKIDEIVGRIIHHGLRYKETSQAGYTQEILKVVDEHRPRTTLDNCHYCFGEQMPQTD